MLPTSSTAAAVILLTIVPGFIATATWARARTWKGPSGDLRTVLQSLSLSAAIQVLISPLTVAWIVPTRSRLAMHASRTALWFFIAVLAVPVVVGIIGARLTDIIFRPIRREERMGWFRRFVRALFKAGVPPTIWDWLLSEGLPQQQAMDQTRPDDPGDNGLFVCFTFKDGSRVGGVFAEGSEALTSPERQGMFLVNEWELDQDGDFVAPIPGTRGILVPTLDEVRSVRILGWTENDVAHEIEIRAANQPKDGGSHAGEEDAEGADNPGRGAGAGESAS